MRKLGAAIAATVAGLAIALLPSGPAQAATPHCNTEGVWVAMQVPMGSGTPYCNMGQGSNSNAVRSLQDSLNYCFYGYQRLVVDGDFGGDTRRALREVQGWIGAAQDGVYGPETFGKMARTGGFRSYTGFGCVILV